MPTIRVRVETRQSLIEQKHGTDTFDDVIMRLYIRSKLLDKLPPDIQDWLLPKEAAPCRT